MIINKKSFICEKVFISFIWSTKFN